MEKISLFISNMQNPMQKKPQVHTLLSSVEYAIWSGLYRIYDTYLYNIYNLLVYNKYKGITSKLDTLYSSVVYVKTVELHMALRAGLSQIED